MKQQITGVILKYICLSVSYKFTCVISSTVQQVKDIFIATRQPRFPLGFPQTHWQTGAQMAAHANSVVKLIEALK